MGFSSGQARAEEDFQVGERHKEPRGGTAAEGQALEHSELQAPLAPASSHVCAYAMTLTSMTSVSHLQNSTDKFCLVEPREGLRS